MACDHNAPGIFEQTVAYDGLLFAGGGMYGQILAYAIR
jgi:hypothetical protein